jgi:tetratricopeptide (TPR) repeat protein
MVKAGSIMKKIKIVLSLFLFSVSLIMAQDSKEAAIKEATGLDIKYIHFMSIEQLNKVIKIDPSNAEVFFWIGSYYLYKEIDYKKAILNFTQAINLNPADLNAYYERGRAYYEIGNYIEAIKDLEIGLQNDGDYYQYRFLAYSYQKIGDIKNAAKYHEIADYLENWRIDEMERN